MFTRRLFAALVPLLAFSFQSCPSPPYPSSPVQPKTAEIWEDYCKDYEEQTDLQRVYVIPKDSLEELSEEELLDKATAGDAAAQCRLGRRFNLFGTKQEWRMWLEKAAEQNNLDAQYNLGVILEKKGETEGIEWLDKAAARGDVDAKYKLGRVYYVGEHISQDHDRALKYFRDLAERGDSHGQFHLGLMYYKGEGVPQDFVVAHSWINLAASRAAENEGARARSLRDLLAEEMTKDQIAEAQNLARQWKPR
jgi:TPR repeat protein